MVWLNKRADNTVLYKKSEKMTKRCEFYADNCVLLQGKLVSNFEFGC